MSKNHENHDQHAGQKFPDKHQDNSPYWKRAHHDWRFWVAMVLALTAISVYVFSIDLSMRPRDQKQAPQQPNVAP